MKMELGLWKELWVWCAWAWALGLARQFTDSPTALEKNMSHNWGLCRTYHTHHTATCHLLPVPSLVLVLILTVQRKTAIHTKAICILVVWVWATFD
jgi:hypothetical protein